MRYGKAGAVSNQSVTTLFTATLPTDPNVHSLPSFRVSARLRMLQVRKEVTN